MSRPRPNGSPSRRVRLVARVSAAADRARPTSPVFVGMFVLGLIWVGWLFLGFGDGFDTFSYWRIPHGPTLYFGTETVGGMGVFRYSPAFADLVAPFSALEWDVFRPLWIGLTIAAIVATTGRWSLAVLGLPFVAYEIFIGNIHALLGLAVVIGLRWPAAWSFLLLTKLTPGVILIWFVVRREWRKLGIALGATAVIIGVSVLIGGPGRWFEWIASLQSTSGAVDGRLFLVRLAGAAAVTAWGAWTDRPWVLPIAATLSLATIWPHSLTILIGILPLAVAARRAEKRVSPVIPETKPHAWVRSPASGT